MYTSLEKEALSDQMSAEHRDKQKKNVQNFMIIVSNYSGTW